MRADIDPSALKSVLPDIFILEMGRNGVPVFRLAGTRVCAILGRELRGEEFSHLWHVPNRHKIKLAVEAVLAGQAPLSVRIRSIADEEEAGSLEMLLMPLYSRPDACDRIFGCLVDLTVPPLRDERSRILLAEGLDFTITEQGSPRDQVDEALSVATSSQTSLRTRIMHLKVFEGGRKD